MSARNGNEAKKARRAAREVQRKQVNEQREQMLAACARRLAEMTTTTEGHEVPMSIGQWPLAHVGTPSEQMRALMRTTQQTQADWCADGGLPVGSVALVNETHDVLVELPQPGASLVLHPEVRAALVARTPRALVATFMAPALLTHDDRLLVCPEAASDPEAVVVLVMHGVAADGAEAAALAPLMDEGGLGGWMELVGGGALPNALREVLLFGQLAEEQR